MSLPYPLPKDSVPALENAESILASLQEAVGAFCNSHGKRALTAHEVMEKRAMRANLNDLVARAVQAVCGHSTQTAFLAPMTVDYDAVSRAACLCVHGKRTTLSLTKRNLAYLLGRLHAAVSYETTPLVQAETERLGSLVRLLPPFPMPVDVSLNHSFQVYEAQSIQHAVVRHVFQNPLLSEYIERNARHFSTGFRQGYSDFLYTVKSNTTLPNKALGWSLATALRTTVQNHPNLSPCAKRVLETRKFPPSLYQERAFCLILDYLNASKEGPMALWTVKTGPKSTDAVLVHATDRKGAVASALVHDAPEKGDAVLGVKTIDLVYKVYSSVPC